MAQQMMWDHILSNYRGQATDGAAVTVEPPAMELASKKAGKTAYDADWWVETVHETLQHWGINVRRWVDAATRMPRLDFTLNNPKSASASPATPKQTAPDPAPS